MLLAVTVFDVPTLVYVDDDGVRIYNPSTPLPESLAETVKAVFVYQVTLNHSKSSGSAADRRLSRIYVKVAMNVDVYAPRSISRAARF